MTPGIPRYTGPVVVLVTAGVELDCLGIGPADLDSSTNSADRATTEGFHTAGMAADAS